MSTVAILVTILQMQQNLQCLSSLKLDWPPLVSTCIVSVKLWTFSASCQTLIDASTGHWALL